MDDSSNDFTWKHDKPTKKGWYARTTPWGRVVWEYVEKDKGGALVAFTETGHMVPIEEFAEYLYWFGPIPRPPPDANYLAKRRGEL